MGSSVLFFLCSFLTPRSTDPLILWLFFGYHAPPGWRRAGRQHMGSWGCFWAFLQHWRSPSELLTAWEHPVGWECAAITCSCIRDCGNEPFLSTCQGNNSAVYSEHPKPFQGVTFENMSVFWRASRANKVCWRVPSLQKFRADLCVHHVCSTQETPAVRQFWMMGLKRLHFVRGRWVVASKQCLILC